MSTLYSKSVPLRPSPYESAPTDAKLITTLRERWNQQDAPLRQRDRQIEENIRMLAGQHWHVYNDLLGRFLDVSRWMSPEERVWKQRPVFNLVFYWFLLTHARLTENPPILTFLPSTGDRQDALLAEVQDVLFKTKWRQTGMTTVLDQMITWMIPCGRAHLISRINPALGERRPWIRRAVLAGPGADGSPMLAEGDIPFDAQGNPLAEVILGPDGVPVVQATGEPHAPPTGDLEVIAASPLECRGQWGNAIPWHSKRWHHFRAYMSPEEVYHLTKQDVTPDQRGSDVQESGAELHRLLFGAGNFGATNGTMFGVDTAPSGRDGLELCTVDCVWEAPCDFPGMQQTDQNPGGRYTLLAGDRVIYDGPRLAPFKYTSPIRCFDFVNLPGRPSGTSPQDSLNPIQRSYNRGWATIQEHRNLHANPKATVDIDSGLGNVKLTNKPGEIYKVRKRPGVLAFEYVLPPPLSADVYKTQELLRRELKDLGNIEGSEGAPPTTDASGELVKELRGNSDRFIGPTARRMPEELGRMAEDWMALLPLVMDEQEILQYTGDDFITRTLAVRRDLFQTNKVNCIPDAESMLPEGRGERQNRVERMYVAGAFGLPGSPTAIRKWMELARFPHIGRTAIQGGVHFVTAQQENGKLAQGMPAEEIPVFEWYDDLIHLAVLEEHMASPEYLRYSVEIQTEFVAHRMAHIQSMMLKQARQVAQQATLNPQPAAAAPGEKGPAKPAAPAPQVPAAA